MKKPDPKTNMVKYLEILTAKEKAVICYLAKHLPSLDYELPKTDFHQGLLPFLPVKQVIHWCRQVGHESPKDGLQPYRRTALGVLAKMQANLEPDVGTACFLMKLNNKKVYRHFGAHPERGKPMNLLPKQQVTVGVKWSLPRKQYIADRDVLVSPCVTMKRITVGSFDGTGNSHMWEVNVSRKCRAAVETWLMDHCM
jgi:hypothetical protein